MAIQRVYSVMDMKQPFEQAVAAHGATVLRVCRAILGPGHDADDAWSETFLAALQAWPDFEEGTNLEAWLVRVAGRKAIDQIRARSRRAIPVSDLPDRAAAEPTGVDDGDLWAAVAALPERQRLAVAYHYFGGLPHTQTAELIGGSPAAVRRSASDGIRRLRRQYGDEHSEQESR